MRNGHRGEGERLLARMGPPKFTCQGGGGDGWGMTTKGKKKRGSKGARKARARARGAAPVRQRSGVQKVARPNNGQIRNMVGGGRRRGKKIR